MPLRVCHCQLGKMNLCFQVNAKNVLCSPFEVSWPIIKTDVRKDVMNLLGEFFDKCNLQRPRPHSYIKDKKKRKEERNA